MVNDELDCTYILILLTQQNDPNGNVVMIMVWDVCILRWKSNAS
jgi:hypothetical protein